MKTFILFSVLFFCLTSTLFASQRLEIETAEVLLKKRFSTISSVPAVVVGTAGKIICGGRFDGKDLEIKLIPDAMVFKAQDVEERFLAYVDVSKQGRVKLAYAWAVADAEYDRLTKVASGLSNAADAALIKELGSTLTTVQYFGFTDNYVHMDMNHGPHALSLSCQLVDK